MWKILYRNIDKGNEFFFVYDDYHRRDIVFDTEIAAQEACRIIRKLRRDSAFIEARPIQVAI